MLHPHHHQTLQPPPAAHHHGVVPPITVVPQSTEPPVLSRVRLVDITPYDGAVVGGRGGTYLKAVEALSGSLMRHNAVVVELGCDDSAVLRCGLESTRLFFKSRGQSNGGGGGGGGGGRGVFVYRAGRALEDLDSSPPCMAEIFRCMGNAARVVLSAVARHLRQRSDVFNHLLDDAPLPANEASSSVVVASYSQTNLQNGKTVVGGGKPATNSEIEKGLLTLISSDYPGIQVCDPNGRWYPADCGLGPGDLLLITGKALGHCTAGLRPAAMYRTASVPDHLSGNNNMGRVSLAFRLIPQGNAILDCASIAAAGHVIPQSFVPISVSQFMDDLSAGDDLFCSRPDTNCEAQNDLTKEPSLRSVLSDPLSGAFLEDAMVVSCGHSFGGLMLKGVLEASRCTVCNREIEAGSLTPNLALRAAAAAIKQEDDKRLFHNAALRKRRKEMGDQIDSMRKANIENGNLGATDAWHKGVQYPFSVNERVIIQGNKRTPEKLVGKEAIITSQCLNGWYLLKIIGSGENVRLQYRSLRKVLSSQPVEERSASQTIHNDISQ